MNLARTLLLAVLFVSTVGIGRSHATSVIVPDDFATVQGAIDSGADSVLVRDGTYDEHVSIDHGLSLLAFDASDPSDPSSLPRVKSLTFKPPALSGLATVRGMTSGGEVVLMNQLPGPELEVQMETCRLEAGIVQPSVIEAGALTVLGSMILANVEVSCRRVELSQNDLNGAGIHATHVERGTYRSNDISAPPGVGINVNGDPDLEVERNTIKGATDGVLVTSPFGSLIRENEIIDCSGTAIRTLEPPQPMPSHAPKTEFALAPVPQGTSVVTIDQNTIQDCRGHGIDILSHGGVFVVEKNTIEKVGRSGIHATGWAYMHVHGNGVTGPGGPGVWLQMDAFGEGVGENRILGGGADGMLLEAGTAAFRNVIGRCRGNGIRIFSGSAGGNTTYLNDGSGVSVGGESESHNNIGFGNLRFGLDVDPGQVAHLSCNDWFGNLAGPTGGIAPDPSDRFDHPLFCDLPNDNVYLSSISPILDAPGCGLIGALGEGCNAPAGIPMVPAGARSLEASPRPARANVRFAWSPLAHPARLEVYDVAGALRWSAPLPAGASRAEWTGTNRDGSRASAGLYYARIVGGHERLETRVVIVR